MSLQVRFPNRMAHCTGLRCGQQCGESTLMLDLCHLAEVQPRTLPGTSPPRSMRMFRRRELRQPEFDRDSALSGGFVWVIDGDRHGNTKHLSGPSTVTRNGTNQLFASSDCIRH